MIYTVYSHDFTINTGDFTITNLECSSTNHWTNMVIYATKLWISPAKAGMSQGTHVFNYQILLFSYGVSWRYNKIMGLNRWYSELVNLRKMTREYQVVFIFFTGVETINRYVQPLNIVVLAIKASQNQNFDQEHYDEFRAFSIAKVWDFTVELIISQGAATLGRCSTNQSLALYISYSKAQG